MRGQGAIASAFMGALSALSLKSAAALLVACRACALFALARAGPPLAVRAVWHGHGVVSGNAGSCGSAKGETDCPADGLQVEELLKSARRAGEPLLVRARTGAAVADCEAEALPVACLAARGHWDAAHLRADLAGTLPVWSAREPVFVYARGTEGATLLSSAADGTLRDARQRNMSVGAFFEAAAAARGARHAAGRGERGGGGGHLYASVHPSHFRGSDLERTIRRSQARLQSIRNATPSVWFGSTGTTTQCHYDVSDNTFVQARHQHPPSPPAPTVCSPAPKEHTAAPAVLQGGGKVAGGQEGRREEGKQVRARRGLDMALVILPRAGSPVLLSLPH